MFCENKYARHAVRVQRVHYHCLLRSGVVRIFLTILAPWIGGLEYIGLMRILICDITRAASSASVHNTVKAPALSPEKKEDQISTGVSTETLKI